MKNESNSFFNELVTHFLQCWFRSPYSVNLAHVNATRSIIIYFAQGCLLKRGERQIWKCITYPCIITSRIYSSFKSISCKRAEHLLSFCSFQILVEKKIKKREPQYPHTHLSGSADLRLYCCSHLGPFQWCMWDPRVNLRLYCIYTHVRRQLCFIEAVEECQAKCRVQNWYRLQIKSKTHFKILHFQTILHKKSRQLFSGNY